MKQVFVLVGPDNERGSLEVSDEMYEALERLAEDNAAEVRRAERQEATFVLPVPADLIKFVNTRDEPVNAIWTGKRR